MKQQYAAYQVVPYPKMRRLEALAYRSVQHKPMIHGLLEVDVTRARARLREHKATTGESLSFTAFLAACLAKAVDEHKAVQAYRKGRKHLIVFDEVDVYTPIERDVAGRNKSCPTSSEPPTARPFAKFITRSGPPRCRTWQKPGRGSKPAIGPGYCCSQPFS